MDAPTEMVRIYLDDLDNLLIFSPYNGTTMATFRFYFCNADDDCPLLHCTFSNLEDLKDNLYYFSVQLIYLLKET